MVDKKKPEEDKTKTQTQKTTPSKPDLKEKKVKEDKSSHKSLLFGILGGVLALILIVVAIIVFRKTPDPRDPKSSPVYTNAFFIYNDGKYTLWNSEGKRLTDEEYNDKSSFVGGYAYVRKGSEYALINDMGKTMLDYGQISSIKDYGAGLYVVNDNNGTQLLMLGNGKILLSGDDLDLDYPSNTATFGAVKTGDTYYIFSYAGVLMAEVKAVEDQTMHFSSKDDFGLIYYNGWNLVFDNRSGKQLSAFEGKRFSFDSVSEDRSTILLDEYDNSESYKVIHDGRLFDLNGNTNYGMIRNSNNVVGFDDYDELSLLNENYEVVKTLSSDLALKDLANYAVINEDNAVDVYYRGEIVRTFSKNAGLVSGLLQYNDLYAIKDEGKYGFYKLDGSFAFGNYADIRSLFDKNHLASVSEDGENYYLIDATGNRVNDLTYRRFYSYDHSYVVYDKDNKRAILDDKGAPITGFDYSEAYNRSVAVDHEIWSLKRESNNYDVVDATAPIDHRMIISGVNVYDFYANYFTVKNEEGGYDYYTYKGIKFFASAKK
ncbi:hypothetical protein IKG06_01065 [Candidatus Saccharibacteria bacterium]|nr:hypothetical protein [Candidatus Saccharibacteria bacterium]